MDPARCEFGYNEHSIITNMQEVFVIIILSSLLKNSVKRVSLKRSNFLCISVWVSVITTRPPGTLIDATI